jgi:DNA-binding NarL/FixJ family response regulator
MPISQILVVDDLQSWHHFILEVLESEKDLKIIAFANDGEEAVKKATEVQPALVLMDVSMPGMSGFEVTRLVRHVSPESKILFVSEYRGCDLVQAAFDAGGSGYVLKSDINSDLILGIRTVLRGRRFVSHRLTRWRKEADPQD